MLLLSSLFERLLSLHAACFAQDYAAPAVAWRLDAASAPVLAHAVSNCAHSLRHVWGFEYSFLAGSEWVYLWPRLPASLGGFEPAQHLAGAFATPPPPTPPSQEEGGARGASSSDSMSLDGATGEGLEARLLKGAPPAEDLEFVFAHCAGIKTQASP